MAFTPTGVQFIAQGLGGYLSDLNQANKAQQGLGASAGGIGGSFLSLGSAVTNFGATVAKVTVGSVVGLTAGLTAFGASALLAGSDAAEMQSKFDTVFGESAPKAIATLDDFAEAIGRNKFDLRGFAATLQDTFVPLGFARDTAADMSVEIVKLSEDLASFNNLPTQQVVEDIQSALVGNTETLRKYGVVANQAQIEQEALNLGLIQNKNELTPLTKAQAIYSLLVKSTTDAQGDATKTAGGFANRMRALRSSFEEFRTEVGLKLLPVFEPLLQNFVKLIQDILPSVSSIIDTRVIPAIQGLIAIGNQLSEGFLSNFGNDFGLLGQAIFAVEDILANFLPENVLQRIYDFDTALLKLTQTVIDEVISGFNSFVEVMKTIVIPAAIAFLTDTILPALTRALEFVNEHWEVFKGAIIGIGVALASAAIAATILGIIAAVTALINPITLIIGAAALLGAAWSQNWLGIRDITAQVGEIVMAVFEAIRSVVVNQVLPSLQTALSNLTGAMNKLGIDWGDVLNALLNATVIVFASIGVAIVTIIGVIVSITAAVANGVATMISWWERLGTDVATIFEGIITAIIGAKEIIVGIITGDLTRVMDGLVLVWEGNVKTITGLFWLIVDTISATLDTTKDVVGTFVGSIVGFFVTLKDTLVGNSIIPDMIESIIGWFERLTGPITSVLSGIASTVSGIFSGLTGGSINFDVGAIGTNIITARREAKEFNEVLEETIDILQELKRELDTAFNRAVDQFRKKVLPALEKVQETFEEFVKDIIKFQSEILPELTKSFQEFGDDVSRVFDDMKTNLDDLLNAIIQFGNDAQTVFNNLQQAMDGAAAAVRRIASDLATMAGSLASISSQIDTVRSKLNQLNSVSLSNIRGQIQGLESSLQSAQSIAGNLFSTISGISNTTLSTIRGAVQGLSSDLSAAQNAANLAKQSFDALSQADFSNFSRLSSQIRAAMPDFNDLATVSGLAASHLFSISNSASLLNHIKDLLQDIIDKAKEAAQAINNIPTPPRSTALSITSTTRSLLSVDSAISPIPVVNNTIMIGPVTISNDMDLAIFEQRVERVVAEVMK